jgi:hypothetical protein
VTTEFAQLNRRTLSRLFPESWGSPPLEQRARELWIYRNCQQEADGSSAAAAALISSQNWHRQLAILARR